MKRLAVVGTITSIEADPWNKGFARLRVRTAEGPSLDLPVTLDDSRGISLGDRVMADIAVGAVIDALAVRS